MQRSKVPHGLLTHHVLFKAGFYASLCSLASRHEPCFAIYADSSVVTVLHTALVVLLPSSGTEWKHERKLKGQDVFTSVFTGSVC